MEEYLVGVQFENTDGKQNKKFLRATVTDKMNGNIKGKTYKKPMTTNYQ